MFDLTIQEIEGEPRMRDIDVAEALSFAQPRKIRDLIYRHLVRLELFGNISTVDLIHKGAGRPGEEYWLNEKQALFICTKSEAPNAIDITIQMIEVFTAYRHGQLLPNDAGNPSEVNEREAVSAIVEGEHFQNYISLVREARMIFGKIPAQRIWKRAGLPMADAGQEINAGQEGEITLFLQEYCICTGQGREFTPVRDLLAAYRQWCADVARVPLPDGTFTRRLAVVAQSYRDPATGFGCAKHKASVSGYLGIAVDPFVQAA